MNPYIAIPLWSAFRKLLMLLLLTGGIMIYIETGVYRNLSADERQLIVEEVRNAEELPESFYKVFNTYYPGYLKNSFWKSVGYQFMNGGNSNWCACREIYVHGLPGRKYSSLTPWMIHRHLERQVGRRKCLEYEMSRHRTVNGDHGLQSASRFYYGVSMDELKEVQMLELIVIAMSDGRADPYRRPGELQQRVKSKLDMYGK